MKKFEIAQGRETPKIILNASNGAFLFSGRSRPEDVMGFYKPVLEWLNEYAVKPLPETIVEFRMEYFSSASAKVLLNVFLELKRIMMKQQKLTIKWFFDEEDDDTREAGENYSKIMDIPFEYVAITPVETGG